MNVTNKEIKYRKLHNEIDEGYLQMVSAERKEYAEAYASSRITENNVINTDFRADRLLEKILGKDNLYQAYEKVKSNKGAGGVDKMGVGELLPYLKENQRQLFQSIKDGKYRPNPVRRVEIPKDNGKMRNLGIPTVVDRVIQQAISQVLTPIFEKQFSDNSYGFRPKRSAHDAMKKCIEYTNEGFTYVVDMDLEKYFDTVNQSKLIEILSRTIKDGRVISLIHKYLKAGVVINHTFKETGVGVPQGGPLSPLLSNIMLNELDQELEGRGHRFVRYADDLIIFCKSKRSASRTLTNILPFIENKLFLKVNHEKTVVSYVGRIKFLGFSFYKHKSGMRLRVHPKAIQKMKANVKAFTARSNGWGNEFRAMKIKRYIQGWINYFKIADMKVLMKQTDE
ncbi:group II intron reverse transcriptase/maturase [Anaerovorax odorimutans]|uniref:group II intron reverse transcriptase/maturase n=1 Tax=Anaerovorax odorimutans TaxID=109327 RepID=UPI000404A63D|nr:group II intron reverse transcriptase/maturase [Anaerovorax odorimutans]